MKSIGVTNGTQWSTARRACAIAAVILPLAANSWAGTKTVLHTWDVTMTNENGGSLGGLAMDARGNLYGVTSGSGACSVGCGSVFKLIRHSDGTFTYRNLYNVQGRVGRTAVIPWTTAWQWMPPAMSSAQLSTEAASVSAPWGAAWSSR